MTGNPLRTVDLHVHTAFSRFRHLKLLLVAEREIGLMSLVGQAYEIVGRYYRQLGFPEGRRHMTPANCLAAAAFVPICLAGAPLFLSLLSYFGTSGVSRLVSRSLSRSERQVARLLLSDGR